MAADKKYKYKYKYAMHCVRLRVSTSTKGCSTHDGHTRNTERRAHTPCKRRGGFAVLHQPSAVAELLHKLSKANGRASIIGLSAHLSSSRWARTPSEVRCLAAWHVTLFMALPFLNVADGLKLRSTSRGLRLSVLVSFLLLPYLYSIAHTLSFLDTLDRAFKCRFGLTAPIGQKSRY